LRAGVVRSCGWQIGTTRQRAEHAQQGLRRPSRQLAVQLADCLGLAGDERASFLALARAELSVDHLPRASQQMDLGLVPAAETAQDAPDQLRAGSIARMRLLGGFALELRSTPLTITSPRLQALLAYLALHRPRQRLAFLLWPDSSESQAHTNLRTLLHRLHAALPDADQLLRIDADSDGTVQEVGQTAIVMPAVGAADLPPGVQAVVARR
jgi:hypothetical protein